MGSSLDPPLSLGEEIANSITHGVGALLSVIALVILVTYSALHATAWHTFSVAIYGTTLILSYLSSTLYHAFTGPRVKYVFRIIDHSAIYLLIAGTYTPFILIALRTKLGVSLLILIWIAAIGGVVFKSVTREHNGIISSAIYIALGWAALLIIRPLLHAVPMPALLWITAGGISYTVGVIFFSMNWRFAHTVWHLFVLTGSICHFIAIFCYLVLRH
jgi:hemolysin III